MTQEETTSSPTETRGGILDDVIGLGKTLTMSVADRVDAGRGGPTAPWAVKWPKAVTLFRTRRGSISSGISYRATVRIGEGSFE